MVSTELESSHIKFLSVNLMTNIFKIIAKYCRRISAKYRHLSHSGNRDLTTNVFWIYSFKQIGYNKICLTPMRC